MRWNVFRTVGQKSASHLRTRRFCSDALSNALPVRSLPVIRRWVYALITASFGLGLAVLGVESGLQIKERIFDNPKEIAGAWKKANALQSSGIDVYPLLVPSMFILDNYDHRSVAGDPAADRLMGLTSNGVLTPHGRVFPLAGLPLKRSVSVKKGDAWPFFTTDEFGFNNPIGQHVPDTIDVALVGDSMVHGTTVEPLENLAGWLRRSGYKVLNLGQGGSGPLLELAILGEYALPLRPKRVVWLFYEGNDFRNLAKQGIDSLVESLYHLFRSPSVQSVAPDPSSQSDPLISYATADGPGHLPLNSRNVNVHH